MTGQEARAAITQALDRHLTEGEAYSGCTLSCGYDGEERAEHLADAVLVALRTLPISDFLAIRAPGYTAPSPTCPACRHPWADHRESGCWDKLSGNDPCPCLARPPR